MATETDDLAPHTGPNLQLDTGVEPASDRVQEAVRAAIADGTLLPGDRLPAVRALATRHALAPNTVAKAYRALERDGYLSARGRAGTHVAASPPGAAEMRRLALAEAAGRYARQARDLDASPAAASKALRAAMASLDLGT